MRHQEPIFDMLRKNAFGMITEKILEFPDTNRNNEVLFQSADPSRSLICGQFGSGSNEMFLTILIRGKNIAYT